MAGQQRPYRSDKDPSVDERSLEVGRQIEILPGATPRVLPLRCQSRGAFEPGGDLREEMANECTRLGVHRSAPPVRPGLTLTVAQKSRRSVAMYEGQGFRETKGEMLSDRTTKLFVDHPVRDRPVLEALKDCQIATQ